MSSKAAVWSRTVAAIVALVGIVAAGTAAHVRATGQIEELKSRATERQAIADDNFREVQATLKDIRNELFAQGKRLERYIAKQELQARGRP